jgi:3-dehydro-L-gulonate 2-dehydrogenase
MLRVSFDEMYNELLRVLLKVGFTKERGELCAKLFAETSRDGVYSHGLNRFPRFIDYISKGYIDIHAEPVKVEQMGIVERWDGKQGPGNLNAHFAMNRAIEIAKENGMGCVALRNTNHWMRAGSYGWQAAEANCIGICWTNTLPNLPPHGSKESKFGNNPLVLAIPREEGPLVLDIAMSQFSYGQLESYELKNKELPLDGGFDSEGNLTKNPSKILQSKRPLPIGFWKGSGLSLMLDMIGMLLSGGRSTYELGKLESEYGVNQVFIAFDLSKLPDGDFVKKSMENTIKDLHCALPADENSEIRYPGEGTLAVRKENLELGVPVDEGIWNRVKNMMLDVK